ncbi:MAG: hypothetical protein K0U98_19645 [Deltaproteobacteria bacterium]|nr:hypothetical protein [Deltaproteobacteria bacterium]
MVFFLESRRHQPLGFPRVGWRFSRVFLCLTFLTGVLCSSAKATVGSCPTVISVTPSAGVAGDPVEISGQGFGSQPDALVAWVKSGDTGLFLDIDTAQDSLLQGQVGSAAAPMTGSLEVWKGQAVALPDAVFQEAGGLVAVTETRILLVQSQASGPSFSFLEGSSLAVGSELRDERLELPLEGVLPCPDPSEPKPGITVNIAVRTNGPPGGSGSGGNELRSGPPPGLESVSGQSASTSSGVAWAATFSVTVSKEVGCPPDLNHALAAAFEDRLGSLGLVVEVVGSELVFSHPQGIQEGLVLLNLPP